MLHVACVRWGAAFGVEYVERLHDMVRRNLPAGFRGRFVCLTDRPDDLKHLAGVDTQLLPAGLSGWWAKLELFRPGTFPVGDMVLYLDLDTCVVGPLDRLAAFETHFALLRDVYRPAGYQSSVMMFRAGTKLTEAIWAEFQAALAAYKPELGAARQCEELWPGGDQHYLEEFYARYLPARIKGAPWPPDLLQSLFPGVLRSYKVDCVGDVPKGTSVVFFHGHPRPHEVEGGWVPEIWKVGGGSSLEFVTIGTVAQDQVLRNVKANLAANYETFEFTPEPNNLTAVICGGAPSLKDSLHTIAAMQKGGAIVLTVNGVERFLRDHGLEGNVHVMCDARPAMAAMHCPGGTKLYASTMDPFATSTAANDPGARLVLWHPATDGIHELIPEGAAVIAGGHTVGCQAIALAFAMGFRNLICFGFDSSYADGAHHAYPQPLNDGERVLDVLHKGRRFKCAPWMVQQMEDFRTVAQALIAEDCRLMVFGDGLIPHMVGHLEPPAASQRAASILARLRGVDNPRGVEVGVFAADLSTILLKARADLTLILVDSWTAEHAPQYAETGDFHAGLTQAQQDAYYALACRRLQFAGPRAQIWRMDSRKAAAQVPDGSLDFVFIDADHSYEGCIADIDAWLPKVRAGGVLCGHDYENTQFPRFGVKRAVDERFPEIELGENFTWFKRVSG
jgi:Methyltransferase domain/6-hydroxymethylpterin diphosphokinase MptE-like